MDVEAPAEMMCLESFSRIYLYYKSTRRMSWGKTWAWAKARTAALACGKGWSGL